jgi:hypothetical protein
MLSAAVIVLEGFQTMQMLSSDVVDSVQLSEGDHEKSEGRDVSPPCMNNSSGGPSSMSRNKQVIQL